MTQDEILEMVREAGGSDVGGHGWTTWVGTQSTEFLERFAKLVADKAAAKEREACAKLCEEMESSAALGPIEKYRTNFIAAAIRARGEQA
jgi:DNA-binding SARP family transcriptional activator